MESNICITLTPDPQVANAISRSLPSRPPEGSRNLLEVEVTHAGRCISQAAVTAASIRRLRWKREGTLKMHTHTTHTAFYTHRFILVAFRLFVSLMIIKIIMRTLTCHPQQSLHCIHSSIRKRRPFLCVKCSLCQHHI